MSINVYKSCPKMISIEKLKILTPLQKIAKECGQFGQIYCFQKALKSCPKSNKSPNLVTQIIIIIITTRHHCSKGMNHVNNLTLVSTYQGSNPMSALKCCNLALLQNHQKCDQLFLKIIFVYF